MRAGRSFGCLCRWTNDLLAASVVALLWLAIGGVALAQPEEKAKARKAASKKDGPGRRFDLPFGPPAEDKLPDDLDSIKPVAREGQTLLPLVDTSKLRKITSKELDELIAVELQSEGIEKATRPVSDDVFVRRVYLDVIGQLPSPADVEAYANSKDRDRKAKLIDYLLSQRQYGVNWARYWRDVIAYRAAEAMRVPPLELERWLGNELNHNAPWSEIAGALIAASGMSNEKPEIFLMSVHRATPEELAGEVARIFMGVQIACAQCHDHPSDVWKRDQFHELASFFGKSVFRIRRDISQPPEIIVEVTERPGFRGEYRKPDLKDPSREGEIVTPVFLTGQPIPRNTSDETRRRALAELIISKRNPYFAKAFVNRMWAELIGFGFTNPVDDLGGNQVVAYPRVFEALAGSFTASNYDIKELFRTILNSRVYDRRAKELKGSYEEEILFTSVTPARLPADQIFDNLDWVLGGIDGGARGGPQGPMRLLAGPRGQFQQTFGFDPSIDREELEAGIPQALMLMNSPLLHGRINAARPDNLLAKLLKTQENDRDVINMLYLRCLARKPTAKEVEQCQSYLRTVSDRSEAFEDILWALLNSTEFLNNH